MRTLNFNLSMIKYFLIAYTNFLEDNIYRSLQTSLDGEYNIHFHHQSFRKKTY